VSDENERWYVGICGHGEWVAACAPELTKEAAKYLKRGLSVERQLVSEIRRRLCRCRQCHPPEAMQLSIGEEP